MSTEVLVTINEFPENRQELDRMERALVAETRERLLRRLGPGDEGLRVWAFGPDWESRTVEEIPLKKIEAFLRWYA